MYTNFWTENRSRKRPLGKPRNRWKANTGADLKSKKVCRCGVETSGLGYAPGASSCEHSNEPSVSIQGGEFD
jgi:hypothetical protein